MARNQGNLLGYARRAQRLSTLRKFAWGLLIFLPISGVAAASIVINSGSTVEFGQGSADVVACDDAFNVEPITEFVNDEFKLDYVQVSDIDTTGCANQVLLVSVYASGNPTAIAQVSRAVSATSLDFDFSTFSPRIDTSNIGSVTVEQAGRAGLVPSLSAATSEIEAFNFTITNYDATYSWSLSATVGSASLDTNTGVVSVTGLTSGQSSTVTVTTTRSGYSSESASVTGSARTVFSFAATGETVLTSASYHNVQRGWGVSIAESGDRAIIGGQLAAEATSGVFVIEESGGSWSQASRLMPSDRPFATISSYSVAPNSPVTISGYAVSNNVVTVYTSGAHGFSQFQDVFFSGSTAPLTGVKMIKQNSVAATSFSFDATGLTNQGFTSWTGTVSNGVTTVTTSSAHGFSVGLSVDFSGDSGPLSGIKTVNTVPSSTTFTFVSSYADTSTTAWSGTVARESYFGYKHSIAMSNDGTRVAVGDALSVVSGKGKGRVYIYDKVGASWVETVITNPASQNGFGASIDISGDGRTLLITHDQSTKLGAWIYYFDDNGNWVKQSNASNTGATDSTFLPGTITSTSYFGENSAQLSDDGNTALVSAYGEPFNSSSFYGAGYVFTRSNGVWTQEARLVGDDFATYRSAGTTQFLGEWGASLSPDGTVVALGSRGDSSSKGAVYVFSKDNGSWSQAIKISNPTATNSQRFGSGIAMSNQGNDLLIGTPWLSSGGINQHGIVYHYVRDGSTWTQEGTITPQTKITNTDLGFRTGQISVTANGQWLMISGGGIGSTYRPYIIVLEGTP